MNAEIDEKKDDYKSEDILHINKNWRGLGNDKLNDLTENNCDMISENSSKNSTVQKQFSSSIYLSEIEIHNEKLSDSNLRSNEESLIHDHDSSLRSSTPLDNQVPENNVLDMAIEKNCRSIKEEGKHFKACPEVNILNEQVKNKVSEENGPKNKKRKKEISYLLINGNISGPVHHNGDDFIVQNTCPYDSTVQLLFNAALEDENF